MKPWIDGLRDRPFSRAEAEALGLTRRMLQGKRFTRIHPNVYRLTSTEPTTELLARAAILALPAGFAISNVTNLQLRGLDIGDRHPIHLSTTRRGEVDRDGIIVHRHLHPFGVELRAGLPFVTAARTFVDVATRFDDRTVMRIGDWLVANEDVSPEDLAHEAFTTHNNGVTRARRVSPMVRRGVESVMESEVRWLLVSSGLGDPETNVDVYTDDGVWLARGDMVYRAHQVLVEYDGWQHERDAVQRQRDHLRREALEAAGWTVVVITAEDLKTPGTIGLRVRQALRRRTLSSSRILRADAPSSDPQARHHPAKFGG